jgi:hypothetical protein
MKFTVLYRIQEDSRAPEFPRLSDYEDAGTVEVTTRGEVLQAFGGSADLPEAENVRPLRTGDVIKDELNRAFIITPRGQMALVTLVSE